MNFDPYTYQPMMRHYYDGALLPQTIAKAEQLKRDQPETSKHVDSVAKFVSWVKRWNPELHATIQNVRPELLDPAEVVSSGSLTPRKNNMGGLFDSGEMLFTSDFQSELATPSGLTSYTYNAGEAPAPAASSWMTDIADYAKVYLSLDQQKKLMDLNLKRAEKGLDPIDNVGAAVNLGITKDVQNMLMLAIGGVVVIGVVSAMRKK